MKRIAAALCGAVLLAAGSSVATAADEQLTGNWTGMILETGANNAIDVWDVVMHITNLDHITIDYAGLDCGGALTYLRTVNEVREYRETLTYGFDKCIDGGVVGFYLNRGKLIWYWSGEGTSEPDAMDVGVLRRQ